jgi:FtsZ-binding cell division protein ZapB
MATSDNYKGESGNGKTPVGMIATSIILGVLLIFLIFMYFDQRHKRLQTETALTEEKDSLANELRGMVHAYDTMRTSNDTLNAGLDRERARIVKLLSVNASNVQLIKRYRNEINTMRDIMKSYIVQIDSLNTRNKVLSAENTEIRGQIDEMRTTNTELSKVREDLNSKVEIASVIQGKDIVATSLNKNSKETKRINLLAKLRVCFTLRENPLATAGTKDVYMRVLRPDSLVITSSADNVFNYKGNQMVYSAMRQVEYANQDIEMCIFLDNNGDFVVGNYSVELYLENNLIGHTTFALTKR